MASFVQQTVQTPQTSHLLIHNKEKQLNNTFKKLEAADV